MIRGQGKAIMIAETVSSPTIETRLFTGKPRRITTHVSATANSTVDIFAKHSRMDTTPKVMARALASVIIVIRTVTTMLLVRGTAATGTATAISEALLNFVKPL